MILFCESVQWNHLPVAGGIYDQDPEFIDACHIVFQMKARKEAQDEKKRQAEADSRARKAKSKAR